MAFIIKQESEDIKIGEVFSIKQEDPEEQTDLMALKEENEEMEEKNLNEGHDFMTAENSIRTETNSVQKAESNKNFSCHQCGKNFRLKESLNAHMKIHTGVKPFKCQQCGKCFVRKGNFKNHMDAHNEKKPFTCGPCGRGYKCKENLNKHMRRKHSGKDTFACRQCGECFSCKVSLYGHFKLHTTEKSFICSLCGDTFLQAGNLNSHMRIHTGEKNRGERKIHTVKKEIQT
ncbi:hypothetical protein Q8A67_012526 [Cirrhinus molitorella]|uniref:C2H2-type domain-containing protein n=1 Tax=Cirrhinus molitorella TaxID=172907 RepID=A0AA88PR09_9TELE|nr:hypothetical protein Q8A67_012526 [Cirrhinus molitorella]